MITKNSYQAAVLFISCLNDAVKHSSSGAFVGAINELKNNGSPLEKELIEKTFIPAIEAIQSSRLAQPNSGGVFLDMILKHVPRE